MAELIAEAGTNLQIWKVRPEEIREQTTNARIMPPEMLERLAENLRKERRLESLPFCIRRRDGSFELVSGHHRTRAARMAGLDEIFILADTRDLGRSQVVAKQLAHNRISGTDDQETLAVLFGEISRVDDILESYVTAADFDGLAEADSVAIPPLSAVVPWYIVNFAFLPAAIEKFDELERRVRKLPRDTDMVGVASADVYARFAEAVGRVIKAENVRSIGAVLTRMIDATLERYPAVEDEQETRDAA